MRLFHYHLVTSRVRQVEARYVGKLAFALVSRHGRIGEDYQSFPRRDPRGKSSTGWASAPALELERGAVNVVVQPGQWELPRVDHLGIALDEDDFGDVVDRAVDRELRVQAHGGRRTFIATNAGYRLEVHPPREWLEELFAAPDALRVGELHLLADDPEAKARCSPSCSRRSARRRASTSATRSSASSRAARRGGRSCTPSSPP